MGPVLAVYLVMSLITFVVYGIDKRRATRGDWRIPERTLHLLEMLGGWPGALVGRRIFRHKRRKASYRAVFALIVLIHLAAWGLAGWMALRR